MIVHRSTSSEPAARGREFGVARREAVRRTTSFYQRVFETDAGLTPTEIAAAGTRVGERLATAGEDGMLTEIEAMAMGAGVEPSLLLAVNARTELIAGSEMAGRIGIECTTAALLPQATADGSCLLAQNWDFHPDAAQARTVWTMALPGDRWLTTFTEAGILAKIGLNGDGVGCVLNFLSTDADGGVEGMPIHLHARRLLERATDLASACELLSGLDSAASTCFTVGHAGPTRAETAAIEVAPGSAGRVDPDRHGRLIHANHFLAPLTGTDLVLHGVHAASTLSRLDTMRRLLGRPGLTRADLEATLASSEGGLCAKPDMSAPWTQRYATLASIVIDLTHRKLWVADPLAPGNGWQQLG